MSFFSGQILWRGFQFQGLYHCAQQLMSTTGRSLTFYGGNFYVERELRASALVKNVVTAYHKSTLDDRHVVFTQSNFRGTDGNLVGWGPTRRWFGEVKYKDIELAVGGERVFKKLEKLGEARFMANIGEKED